jgi:hypothetical protein
MSDNKLSAVVKIDGIDYEVTAKKAELAENAEKLGGTAASDYAKKTDLFSKNYNDLTNKPTIPANTNQTVKADGKTFGANDIVEFVAGANVTISGDTANKKITISATGGEGGGSGDYATEAGHALTADYATEAGTANYIQVNMENSAPYAVITISGNVPSEGKTGDIWFKI